MSFKEQLEEYQVAWSEAEVNDGGSFENLPDGKYQVSIEEVRFENAKASGRLQLAWVFNVLSGKSKGRKVFHYRGLDSEESVGWMKNDIHRCGLKVESITDLPDMLPQLLDRVIEITLKTKKNDKGEFQNCFINKLLSSAVIDGQEVDDQDCPF